MSDREKVEWLKALLCLWGSAVIPLTFMAVGAPVALTDAPAAIGGLLAAWTVTTVIYLLVLSWRAAYLSGRASDDG